MEFGYFFRGLIIGLAIAAPVGPIGVLCVQRTLNYGMKTGFVSGLGAATADAAYGIIAAFSISAIFSFLTDQRVWFSSIGGIYLCYLGYRAFRSIPVESENATISPSHVRAYLSTFVLTLTNPMTILSFAAIFAGFGLSHANDSYLSAAVLVSGVFLGSALWWLCLSSISGLFRGKFKTDHLRWVNRISGIVITGFGVFAIAAGILR